MRRDFLKVCVLLSFMFASHEIQANVECDCYMEYQDIKTEAKVYESEETKFESMVEFSLKDKLQIEEANALLAEAGPSF